MCARILVADDDDGYRYPIRCVLEDHGFEVVEAVNKAEAIEHAESSDLWIIDVRLPSAEMEGIVAVTELADRGIKRDLIFMSVLPEEMASAQLGKLRNASVDFDWLEKPFDLQVLLATIRKYQRVSRFFAAEEAQLSPQPMSWVPHDKEQSIIDLFLSLKTDEPLPVSLRKVFCSVTSKLMFYTGCDHGMHMLGNAILTEGHLHKLELDHLYIDPATADRLDEVKISGQEDLEDDELPRYVRISRDRAEGRGLQQYVHDGLVDLSVHKPGIGAWQAWRDIIRSFNARRKDAGELPPVDWKEPVQALVFPLDEIREDKFPLGRLGTILLWDNRPRDLDRFLESHYETLVGSVMTFEKFAHQLFETHYDIGKETYLPSYKTPGPRSVAILFADIRDFTPMTEIARNFDLIDDLTKFMSLYCQEMCELIQQAGGRVHNLAGDGIMALFGEYTAEKDAVVAAVESAKKMCVSFEKIKEVFFRYPKISGFVMNEYEPMDFRLGIGINFGEVIFDYFGAEGSRVYSPLGDHVNFAQRLESEASRFDERLVTGSSGHPGRMRAPILLSRPAWIRGEIGPRAAPPHLNLQVKGKPYAYPAYEVWPDSEQD